LGYPRSAIIKAGRRIIKALELIMNDYNLKNLIDLFKLPKSVILEKYSSYFYTYFRSYFADPDNLFRKLNEMKTLALRIDLQMGVWVDLGCGFGLESIVLSILSSDKLKIIGIDHNEEKIRLGRKLAMQCQIQNIDFILQSGENLPKELNADVVFCRDVISHVNDIHIFFKSVSEILNAKGIFYIIDDQNALSFLTIWKTKKLQKKAERGPIEVNRLRENDPHKNFFNIREEIILRKFRYMKRKKIAHYAAMTAGLYGDQIIYFVQSSEKGEKLDFPRFKYVNPLTGESVERLYNPIYVKRVLKKLGFQVTIEKPFFGISEQDKGLRKVVASVRERFHPLSLFISPMYFIKATKN
jgi:2-polyprenyl-3-methyl-5-hydroxy-6-metoxy-1,4-benzoquinol methylase